MGEEKTEKKTKKAPNKGENTNYNIGLDIGTGSVGWCVTDENNNILKFKNKHMWGSRIFDEAKTKADTRLLRGARRREQRRRMRIIFLQEILGEEVTKVDSNFFNRLNNTKLTMEDKKSTGYFNDGENIFLNEKEYYEKYPTIYHLRNRLVTSTEKMDIRLVYLAIHHIIKYRGNFLYEGELNSIDEIKIDDKIRDILEFVLEKNEGILLKNDNLEETITKIINISKDTTLTRSSKLDKLINLFDCDSSDKKIVKAMFKAILGYKFSLKNLFQFDDEDIKISFSENLDKEDEIITKLDNNIDYYEDIKAIYNWEVLDQILIGTSSISKAFIKKYENFEKDLKLLKSIYKKYLSKKDYNNMFRIYFDKDDKEDKKSIYVNNFVAYNGKNNLVSNAKCSQEDFYKLLNKELEKLPEDCEEIKIIEDKIKNNEFLVKLNTVSNSAIPYQLNKHELEKIIDNQSKYYDVLKQNKEKIISLLTFRIPYYVGPLKQNNEESKFGWVIRKNNENIRPWNFDEMIDKDSTAEKFILRMTNKCTYLPTEDVMPKESLLYSEFTVLQELNNIRINERKLSKSTKLDFIENIFKKEAKVTKNKIISYYNKNGHDICEIDGLQDGENFMSNMKSYIDFSKILGKDIVENNKKDCEKIIYYITIFEDKKILKRKIEKEFKQKLNLTAEQISKLSNLRYKGWSRLSEKLLIGIKSIDNCDSVMDKLLNNNENFMQIINNKKYGFDKIIENAMPKNESKISYNDIEEIPTSPANKRAIWQTVKIVQEIVKIMNSEPQNIYIEFARNEDEKTMKDSRVNQLIKKYEEIKKQIDLLDPKDLKRLKGLDSKYALTEKQFLYYLQGGKCLYSGEYLDIENLQNYEVDHIIPQHYIKDDSIDNKALVKKIQNQRKSGSILLKSEIIDARLDWWHQLKEYGLMSTKKFNALTRRTNILEDEATNRFVNRQLVETRQITKYTSNLLDNYLKNTTIFALRAGLTHGFREKYSIYKNRNVNNLHHAKDAYIISIIGNTLDNYWYLKDLFKYNNNESIKAWVKHELNKKEDERNKNDFNENMILGFINKHINVEEIKKYMNYKDCFISKMLEENNGEYWHQTIISPKKNPVIPLKNGLNPSKYGGYTNEYKAYCAVYRYLDKKGKKYIKLIGISIKDANDIKNKKNTIENVILKNLENIEDFKIIKSKILINQEFLDENNNLLKLCSDREIKSTKELILTNELEKLIYLINTPEKMLTEENKKAKEAIDTEKLQYLFKKLVEKLKKEYPIFNSSYEKIIKNIDKFYALENKEKIATINNLIDLMEKSQGNFSKIGLTGREGRMGGKNICDDYLINMTFVNKSVTGMYERRYKLNWDGEQLL